jgi:RNA polymerase sigma-70 factor (ECF subfamily)
VPRSDRDLFAAWTRGDIEAAAELFERHFAAIDRFFRNKVMDGYDDLVQQTFTACLESRDRYRGDASFRTYLFAIANNILRSHFRSRQRDAERFEWTEVSVCDLTPGPSTLVREGRERALLLESLRRIPLAYQVVLELYYWEELSAAAIAEIVSVPENTVRSRLRRGKQLVEAQLELLANDPAESERTRADLVCWSLALDGVAQNEDSSVAEASQRRESSPPINETKST